MFFQALGTDALLAAADAVAVDDLRKDADRIHPGKGQKVVFLVCIETVLSQADLVVLQDLCAVGNGMHGEPLVASQGVKVHHLLLDILRLIAQLLVSVLLKDALELSDDHILLRHGQFLYEIDKSVPVKPVISVQQAEIFSCRRLDGGIHG